MRRPLSEKRRIGELRPSQLLSTFGVGAIVELPSLSVMVMGLDDWPEEYGTSEIPEPRLLRAVQEALGAQVTKLRTPPVVPEAVGYQAGPFEDTPNLGVPVAPFPRWQVCPYCRLLAPIHSGLFELKLDPYRKDRCRYSHRNCAKLGRPPTVVPARFLVACEHGHLDDFPWVRFVHRGTTDCHGALRLFELGASGEVTDIEVQCLRCEKARRMSDAFVEEGRAELAQCRGRWPHLRAFEDSGCQGRQRALLLGASNSWFPLMLSALSIPTTTDKLGQLIAANWAELEECEDARDVRLKRRLLRGLTGYTEEQIWAAVAEKKSGTLPNEEPPTNLREPEWQVLSQPDPALNSRDFQLRVVDPPPQYRHVFQRVVLAERLREVRSLIGFTRIASPGDATDVDEFPTTQRAPLSRTPPRWVPTCDVRGEGIFLQVSEVAMQTWLRRPVVQECEQAFFGAHQRWRTIRGLEPNDAYPTMRYVFLHSLAHALLRQFAVECGYTTASIRERIYSRPASAEAEPMAGILLYTAAPDSEGTLGGLVSLGEPQTLGRHLDQALEAMRLCTSDPLCAEHPPSGDSLTLHGAACHACLFAPETSCERGNKYLDRSVLVATIEAAAVAFVAARPEALSPAEVMAQTPQAPQPPPPASLTPQELDVLVAACDERCQAFLQAWAMQQLSLPVIGYELQDASGRICAQAELAWPQGKVAAVLPDDAAARARFGHEGWHVMDATALAHEAATLRQWLGV